MPDNTELIADLRARLVRIRDRKADNDMLLAKLGTARSELAELAATVSSPDGTVTVTAGPGGIVRSVCLSDNALRTTATALSHTIDATVRQAVAEATARQLDIIRTHVGDDIDPNDLLGPQAKFAELATSEPPRPPLPAMDADEDQPPSILAVR